MKLLNITAVLLLLLTTVACSSTKTVKIEKKPLISDHYLMMSLLDRPMTQDQQLMLAFAKQQDTYQQTHMPMFVNAVMIKGERTQDTSSQRSSGIYSSLIANDINSISVTGPY